MHYLPTTFSRMITKIVIFLKQTIDVSLVVIGIFFRKTQLKNNSKKKNICPC